MVADRSLTIVRTTPTEWIDPWGNELSAELVHEVLAVDQTDETVRRFIGWGGKNDYVTDTIYVGGAGRRFQKYTPTDFGGRGALLEITGPDVERAWFHAPLRSYRYVFADGKPWLPFKGQDR